jgi:hypothetical protein
MKFTFDKNFLFVQFTVVVLFYLINSIIISRGTVKHFTGKDKIEASDLMLYVLGLQFGAPGSIITPVSNEAITLATIQKILFVAFAFGALSYTKDNTEWKLFITTQAPIADQQLPQMANSVMKSK